VPDIAPSCSPPALTAAIASGDPEAFARFYDAWFDRALAEARRCTGRDDEFCLDVVQDAMMRVIRFMRPLASEAAVYRWMRVVIRSCACDRLRADIRRRHRERHVAAKAPPAPAGTDVDRLAWLHEQLEHLDEPDVHLLIMRHRFGWTLHRIGTALGMSHSAVDRRLRRLMERLRRSAKEDFDGLSTL
jgi:RNA polymerase sigma factor (sigma-70 family)